MPEPTASVYRRFADAAAARRLLDEVSTLAEAMPPLPGLLSSDRRYHLMEVCGTHTHAIARLGLRELLPAAVKLLSGPGCPVCVTPVGDVDLAIALAQRDGVIVATFGDMMRVPGSELSLSEVRAQGGRVEVVYSPIAALELAVQHLEAEVVFLGVGFETTAPAVASTVLAAEERGVRNLSVLCCHKLIPPAMWALLASAEVRLDGFLCPGHVSTIIGAAAYGPMAERFGVPCVVAGFEPLDILLAIKALLAQIARGQAQAENAYERTVRWDGNPKARAVLEQVFEVCDSQWRGLGAIPRSGLRFRERYAAFDALQRFDPSATLRASLSHHAGKEHPGCHCGEVLRGLLDPPQCRSFGKACTPERPLGPCMVSSEGACAAWYKHQAVTG